MALQPIREIAFDDWLAAERANPGGRTEYVAGEVFAMAGGSEEHNLIVANVVGELRGLLKHRPYRVYPSDMKVRIDSADAGVYPDVMVICGERRFHDNRRDVVTNPDLIVEVLSDSTEDYDRGQKFDNYRGLESLHSYLLIAQDRIAVDLFQRLDGDHWALRSFTQPDACIPLSRLNLCLAVAEVYDKVDFPTMGAG